MNPPRLLERKDASAPYEIKKICVIGAGHVGTTTAAVMAYKAPHVQIHVVDTNESRIAAWQSSNPPIYEPGLRELLRDVRDGVPTFERSEYSYLDPRYNIGESEPITHDKNYMENNKAKMSNLTFSTEISRHIADADAVFICVNTPARHSSDGDSFDMDLTFHDEALRMIVDASSTPKIIIEKSTVPCGTAERVSKLVAEKSGISPLLTVLSNPEFLAQGTSIGDLMNPDRVIIGSSSNTAEDQAASDALKGIYSLWVPLERIITMSLFSSELTKLAHNAFLAQRISSINSLSAICELQDADITEVAQAIGMNQRIGPKYLQAGLGFGGSCLVKDTASLVFIAKSLGLHEVAEYWRHVIVLNEYQKTRFANRILEQYGKPFPPGERITVLGFAYKRETRDARGTPAKDIILHLLKHGASIELYDPHVAPEEILRELGLPEFGADPSSPSNRLRIHKDLYSACEGTGGLVLLNNPAEFVIASSPPKSAKVSLQDGITTTALQVDDPGMRQNDAQNDARVEGIDWARISTVMKAPRFLFDGRCSLNVSKMSDLGFEVLSVGLPKGKTTSLYN